MDNATRTNCGGHRADDAVFVPPPANKLAETLAALERFINDADTKTAPVIKAALAHVQFETIHPFMDGNGRLGRMLIPLIMVEAKVLQEPMLYLSVFFKKHRQTYYDLLQKVRTEGDWEAWLLFFMDAITATASQAVSTAQKLTAMLVKDKAEIAGLGRASGSATQVLDAMFARPVSSISALAKATGLIPATIGKALDALQHDAQTIREVSGLKRNRIFAYAEYIQILNEEVD